MTVLDRSTTDLLGEQDWSGSFWTGRWTAAAADAPVVAPGSGEELGRIGIAGAAEVTEAAARAAAAQREWAATPFEERAALLRRAGALFESHAAEIEGWIIRESGGIPPKASL
jgi:benzaldehyde dehydrogenase (NAD)